MNLRPSLIYGLINGVAAMILFLVVYFTGSLADMFSLRYTGSALVISIMLLVLGIKADKKQMQGRFPFREAFFSGLLFFAVGWVLDTTFNQFMVRVVDPQLPVAQKTITMEKTEQFMVEYGAKEEDIQKTMDQMEAADPFSRYTPGGILQGLLMTSIGAAVVSLIAAAFLREKRKPEYLDENQTGSPH